MAVRIRLKKLGRRHRPYFRICVMDARTPRDGRVIEEVGTYDPLVRDTDKRCTIAAERVDYWIGVGALPTEKVKVLLDKYKGKVPGQRVDQRVQRAIPELPPPKPRQSRRSPPPAAEAPEAAPAEAESTAAAESAADAPAATEEQPTAQAES